MQAKTNLTMKLILLASVLGLSTALNASSVLLVPSLGGTFAPPELCSAADLAILSGDFADAIVGTEITTIPSLDVTDTTTGSFRVDYAADECVEATVVAALYVKVQSIALTLTPECSKAVLSNFSIGCVAVYDDGLGKEPDALVEAMFNPLAGCLSFCLPYCLYVTNCLCWYLDPRCKCCNCNNPNCY